jgi:1-acyl-sn-glycerol-3-phosphate acyltransferase
MRESLDTWIRTAVCVLVLPAGLILYSAWAVLLALLGAPRQRIDRCYTSFSKNCLRFGGTQLVVHGTENLKPDQAYVIVPNHESNWDPVGLLVALEQLSVRFIVKRQIMQVPVFGQALRATGNVRVERSNTQLDAERIREGMAERALDVSVLFYAEGTRSRDGALHPFKMGAFVTAINSGLPVLPIGHAGSYRIWTPLSLWVRKLPMVVEIGAPIPVDALTSDNRDRLREETHKAVASLRMAARKRLREMGYDPGGID